MFGFNRFFVFLYIVSFLLLITKMNVLAEKNLPSIFTDDAFVNDDICSSVINEHPCVKNILEVVVHEINQLKISSSENLQKVGVLKEHQEKLKRELSESKRQIKFLEKQLKTLELEEQTNPEFMINTAPKENPHQYEDYFNTIFEKFNNLNWLDMDNIMDKVDNTTMVRWVSAIFYLLYHHKF